MSLRGRRHGGGRKNELVFLTTCGPATTFDPKITGVAGTWFFDDGTTLAASSGSEISKTFATDGLHRAVFRAGTGGLAAITDITINADLISGDVTSQILKCANLGSLTAFQNTSLYADLSVIMARCSKLVSLTCGGSKFFGGLSIFSSLPMTKIDLNYCSLVTGSVSELPVSVLTVILYNSANITSGSLAHLISARQIDLRSIPWLTADVDTVIDSIWAARANYTYATGPSLQIGGTNQAPTGNVIAPEEGDDWHLDGATWIPLTSGAKIWDLAKNVNSEARTAAWTITYTGGSIAP